jgi:hypothetical protein
MSATRYVTQITLQALHRSTAIALPRTKFGNDYLGFSVTHNLLVIAQWQAGEF